MKKRIPQVTVERLPLYHRSLKMLEEMGRENVSSIDLGQMLQIMPEQIRKDLSIFGKFGRRGLGYPVTELKNKIESILGLRYGWRIGIVGIGHLGSALANYDNFSALGFTIAALFDIDEKIIGSEVNGFKVYDFGKFESLMPRKKIDIGIITVPAAAAQKVSDTLTKSGVKAIWNFTPVTLEVPLRVQVVNEDFSVGLGALSFYLAKKY